MKHEAWELKQMQAVPLQGKITMTKSRIRQWYDYWDGNVYVSFSGGKDSTVLKHIVDSMYDDVPAFFVNTGLEYPEIQKFVTDVKSGEYDCFNTNVEISRPEMRFDEVIKAYGYPVISKEVAQTVYEAKRSPNNSKTATARMKKLNGELLDKNGKKSMFNCEKWRFMLDAPYDISDKCCKIMKKKPAKKFSRETGRKPFIGTLASESLLRKQQWMRYGCNAFDKSEASSQPLSFWTDQDVLCYLKKYEVPYCSVYGEIVPVTEQGQIEFQMNMYDVLGDNERINLTTTGCKRTGCIFCMFGCHLEKEPNRFQLLKESHPQQYKYCIGGVTMKMENGNRQKAGLVSVGCSIISA